MTESGIEARLRVLREKARESQEAVAEACGISRIALARYETGARTPQIDIASKLAGHYGVSVDYLLGREEQGPSFDGTAFNPRTDYAKTHGPETQAIINEILDKLEQLPDSKKDEFLRTVEIVAEGLSSKK